MNRSLIISRGEKITIETAEKSVMELGRSKLDLLDTEHIEILTKGNFNTADQKALDLLFSLAVFKYNGERKINPLIIDLLEPANNKQ